MEIYMQKIGLIRDDVNPKNLSLNLDIDWAVEYRNTDQEMIDFDIILKSCEKFELNFKIEGIIILGMFEKFSQEEVSQIIFHKACKVLMDMVSITRESSHILSNSDDSLSIGSEHIQNTLLNYFW
ncbi:pilus assembly protein [Methanobrevibacter sp.]|uniref:pilus assembly protein n=1 Tax=Methanobrevibacter sp. TaxID=66852 RepID=UPI003890BA50